MKGTERLNFLFNPLLTWKHKIGFMDNLQEENYSARGSLAKLCSEDPKCSISQHLLT